MLAAALSLSISIAATGLIAAAGWSTGEANGGLDCKATGGATLALDAIGVADANGVDLMEGGDAVGGGLDEVTSAGVGAAFGACAAVFGVGAGVVFVVALLDFAG